MLFRSDLDRGTIASVIRRYYQEASNDAKIQINRAFDEVDPASTARWVTFRVKRAVGNIESRLTKFLPLSGDEKRIMDQIKKMGKGSSFNELRDLRDDISSSMRNAEGRSINRLGQLKDSIEETFGQAGKSPSVSKAVAER